MVCAGLVWCGVLDCTGLGVGVGVGVLVRVGIGADAGVLVNTGFDTARCRGWRGGQASICVDLGLLVWM